MDINVTQLYKEGRTEAEINALVHAELTRLKDADSKLARTTELRTKATEVVTAYFSSIYALDEESEKELKSMVEDTLKDIAKVKIEKKTSKDGKKKTCTCSYSSEKPVSDADLIRHFFGI